MNKQIKTNILNISLFGLAFTTGSILFLANSAQAELPEQMPGWCKNEVVNHYNSYMADVSITGWIFLSTVNPSMVGT